MTHHKNEKKHCCSLLTTLANDYHCHNQVVGGFIIQTKVSGRNLHFKTQKPRKSWKQWWLWQARQVLYCDSHLLTQLDLQYLLGGFFFNWKNFTKKEKLEIKIMKVQWLLGIFNKPELKDE